MIVVGLCGRPAGGKSAVSAILHRLGAVWVNADRIAHEVLLVPQVVDRLVMQFGSAILNADGQIDRPRLASVVFGDDEVARAALRYLESIVHPRTRVAMMHAIQDAIESDASVVVLDVPLLFESGWDVWCDEIWFIDTPQETVMEAATGRGWTVEMLDKRIASQLSIDEKRRLSTQTIDNRGTLKQLELKIGSWWERTVVQTAQSEQGLLMRGLRDGEVINQVERRVATYPIDQHCRHFVIDESSTP